MKDRKWKDIPKNARDNVIYCIRNDCDCWAAVKKKEWFPSVWQEAKDTREAYRVALRMLKDAK